MGATNKPDLKKIMQVMKLAELKPLEPYTSALTRWKCLHIPCGNVVYPKYNAIQQGGGGCRTCRYIKSGNANRMNEDAAISIMLNAGLKPLEPYKNSVSRWKSICLKCNNIGFTPLGDVRGGHGCYQCGIKATADSRRKDEGIAIQIMLDHGYQPLEPYENSNAKWKSKCVKCKKTVYPTFGSVQYADTQCEYCAGNKIDPKDAKKIMLAAKLKPLEPYIDSKTPWKCECLKCGNIVLPSFGGVNSGQGGCVTCGAASGGEKNRTPENEAVAIMLEAKLKPLVPYKSRHTPWKSQCLKCNAIVTPMLGTVMDGSGCIICTPFGINLEKPSYVYLISHSELSAHKVGIGNVKKSDDRLGKFNKRGWQTHKVWNMETGAIALNVEKIVFRVIRKELKLPVYLVKEQMPVTGGHSETIDADAITLLKLENIINKAIKGLQK